MSISIGTRLRHALIFAHRWLGVLLCLLFLLWFPSGIVMMYWDYPSVTAKDRLERSPALDVATVRLSPIEAAITAELGAPTQLRLNTFDGRPVYRIRAGRNVAVVYADTGDVRDDVSKEVVDRMAAAWTRKPLADARVQEIEAVDQWTVQTRLPIVEPLWKYSWPDGQQVYVSQGVGEVIQYTTTASRWTSYFGAIPHWLYFTPLRRRGLQWTRVVTWSSGVATLGALLGIVIGIWMYSPGRRYRYNGAPTSIPYRGQKRWHTIFGLLFGIGAVTWAFSGMLSMDPFPARRNESDRGVPDVPGALRGQIHLTAFKQKAPQEALAQLSGLDVKELEFIAVAGQPAYLATLAGGDTRIVPMTGAPQRELDRARVIAAVTEASQPDGLAEIRVLDHYDRYYLDRRRVQPLPVILARLNEPNQTRFYIDPRTGRVVGSYSATTWMSRWLYHGLHSLDFPWLYQYRPLWDIVVLTFMLGGTALCVTSLILVWRVLGRKLRSGFGKDSLRELALTEDLPVES